MAEETTNKEAPATAKNEATLHAVLPLNPFLAVREDGGAEIVFMAPDGRIVGKDDKFNEEFAEKIEAQILRAKIASANSSHPVAGPK